MKQWFTLNYHDLLVMLVNYPAVFVANYLILGPLYFDELRVFVPVTLGITVLYFLFAWMMDSWMKYMRHRYTELDQVARRVTYCLLFYVLSTALLVCLVFWLYGVFRVPGYRYNPITFRWTLLIGFMTNILSVGIFESIYSYEKWKESVKREYEMKQVHMQRQLDMLKQQVNPHFLFNSLNSLISLIGENPRQAEVFAEELSSVYRYLLRSNETALTPLANELEFIQSYYHLLKTRHGEALTLVTCIHPGTETWQLPPLTLQLLIENAVKHNVTLAEQPLIIEIRTDEQARLSVRNTLQKKQSRALSNGIGLNNILCKYQMLGYPLPIIQEAKGQFVVTLPLIKPV